ncbi:C2H2-type zinc finger-containing protein [Reticulomyxa filosa]|uniref:C2H2-type zinc finger-containing protein n=1 Tax=Reticulomyxa filosa TaxID=46433 RepID=X6NF09_RETFI|nr:C2H2-type zinc finger-containing protein [Reticulomyxa filosa]|eukprot:ETO24488.1 C2H2-type zinc finger-containing protein [Reticulomyxa filosa]
MSVNGKGDHEIEPNQEVNNEGEEENGNENENDNKNDAAKEKKRKDSLNDSANENNNTTGGTSNSNASEGKNRGRLEQNEKAKLQILKEVFGEASKTGKLDKSMLPASVCRSECMKLWRQVLTTEPIKNIKFLIKQIKIVYCQIFFFFLKKP